MGFAALNPSYAFVRHALRRFVSACTVGRFLFGMHHRPVGWVGRSETHRIYIQCAGRQTQPEPVVSQKPGIQVPLRPARSTYWPGAQT